MNLQENIHRIKQVMKLMEQEQEVLNIPSIELFGDWETLQKFLERRGNPPYSIGGDVDLYESDVTDLGNLVSVGGWLNLRETPIESLGNLSSVGGYLKLRETPIAKKYTYEQIRKIVNVKGTVYL